MDASLRSAHRKQNREWENPYDRGENGKLLSLDKWIQLNRIQQQQQPSFTNGELVTELTHLKMFVFFVLQLLLHIHLHSECVQWWQIEFEFRITNLVYSKTKTKLIALQIPQTVKCIPYTLDPTLHNTRSIKLLTQAA